MLTPEAFSPSLYVWIQWLTRRTKSPASPPSRPRSSMARTTEPRTTPWTTSQPVTMSQSLSTTMSQTTRTNTLTTYTERVGTDSAKAKVVPSTPWYRLFFWGVGGVPPHCKSTMFRDGCQGFFAKKIFFFLSDFPWLSSGLSSQKSRPMPKNIWKNIWKKVDDSLGPG